MAPRRDSQCRGFVIELPAGSWKADWLNTKTGAVDKTESFAHGGGRRRLDSPKFIEDIALGIRRIAD